MHPNTSPPPYLLNRFTTVYSRNPKNILKGILRTLEKNAENSTFLRFLGEAFEATPPSNRSKVHSKEKLFLSPLIKKCKLNQARKAALVDPKLLKYDIESYSGYITVNEKFNSNLFFWYFPVQDKPITKTPWIIWFQDGPGASSLYGLFEEMGPFRVNDKNLSLEEREFKWTQYYSMVFIDNPVGTGFSFTEHEQGLATNQKQISQQLYHAVKEIVTVFSELQKAPLYLAGQGYAGKHVPSLALEIHKQRNTKEGRLFNLQGLVIGNGWIDPLASIHNSEMMLQTGLINYHFAEAIKHLEGEVKNHIEAKNFTGALLYYEAMYGVFIQESNLNNLFNYLDDDLEIEQNPFARLIETEDFRDAIHVGDTSYSIFNPMVYTALQADYMKGSKEMVEKLLRHYRILSYAGQLDIVCPPSAMANTFADLLIDGEKRYREAERYIWYHDQKVAGYFKQIGNLTEVMVRNAGTMVPMDQPSRALGLIHAFIRGESLLDDTGLDNQPC